MRGCYLCELAGHLREGGGVGGGVIPGFSGFCRFNNYVKFSVTGVYLMYGTRNAACLHTVVHLSLIHMSFVFT
jgi:hypothetical protein